MIEPTLIIVLTVIATVLITSVVIGLIYLILNSIHINNSLNNIARDTDRLLTIASNISSGDRGNPIWQTADGKYTASSFDELLMKMANDPDSPLSEEQIQTLKDIFEKIIDEPNEDAGGWS